MKPLQILPIVLSLLLLAAHFLRSGCLPLVIGVIALLGLLTVRRPWVARSAQAVLMLGALEWARTLATLVAHRAESDEPVLRLVAILGTVIVFTLGSALLFQTRTLAETFRFEDDDRGL